jgi:EmrB/QacA subfamily drug resistance transporter
MREPNKWLILGAAVFGLFMAILDATVVTIAVPTIEQSLKANIEMVTWVLNSYNLAIAVLLIPAGRVADRWGRKKVFIAGIIIFTVFSFACGIANNIDILIAFRTFQAVGAAIMVPVSLAIVVLAFPPEQRGAAVGIWGAVSAGAGAIGPTLGGVLTEYAGWEWIFFVNVPIGIAGVIACSFLIPESREEGARRVDPPGVAALSICLFALTLALVRGETVGWSSTFILALFATSAVFAVLFVIVESIVDDPIVNLRLFAVRTFTASNATMVILGLGFFGTLFLFVQWLTVVQGYSALKAGLALTPAPASIMAVGPFSGRLSDRFGSRPFAVSGMIVFGIAMWLFSQLSAGESYVHVFWRLIVAGIGAGLVFSPLASAAMGALGGGRQAVGSGVFNTSRQIGFTLGLAVLVAIFLGALHPRLAHAETEANQAVQQSNLPSQLKQAIVQGVDNAVQSASSSAVAEGQQQKFDLYSTVAQMAGPQVADANRQTLDQLSKELQSLFAGAADSSFDRTFIIAAIILWTGAIPALFIGRAGGATEERQGKSSGST